MLSFPFRNQTLVLFEVKNYAKLDIQVCSFPILVMSIFFDVLKLLSANVGMKSKEMCRKP